MYGYELADTLVPDWYQPSAAGLLSNHTGSVRIVRERRVDFAPPIVRRGIELFVVVDVRLSLKHSV